MLGWRQGTFSANFIETIAGSPLNTHGVSIPPFSTRSFQSCALQPHPAALSLQSQTNCSRIVQAPCEGLIFQVSTCSHSLIWQRHRTLSCKKKTNISDISRIDVINCKTQTFILFLELKRVMIQVGLFQFQLPQYSTSSPSARSSFKNECTNYFF